MKEFVSTFCSPGKEKNISSNNQRPIQLNISMAAIREASLDFFPCLVKRKLVVQDHAVKIFLVANDIFLCFYMKTLYP